MSGEYGSENLTEIADAALATEALFVKVLADGEINKDDLPTFLGSTPDIASKYFLAFKDIDVAWLEIKDLDSVEGTALVAHIATKLTVPEEKAKQIATIIMEMAIFNLTKGIELSKAIRS